jgi:mannose-6-phosphate isomerase-like protein (cupin superfamily)
VTPAAGGPRGARFELAELARRRPAGGVPWLELLATPTQRVGFYELAAGEADPQRPHTEDEVYHVVRGRAVLSIDGEDRPVGPGSVAFVAAGVDHRFHSIAEELSVLVFFSR